MDRHDESHRSALRHRSRAIAQQGGCPTGRLVSHHRHENLHLGRRARSRGEHRASRAGADRGRARGGQGHLAVRGAEVLAESRRHAGQAQRRLLRLDRGEDGHSRQFHLRHELRRRDRLARRRGQSRAQCHVHDDERRPPRRRRAGARAIRGRLSECCRLCQGAPAGPLLERDEIPGQGRGSDHRPPRRSPHPAEHPIVQ